MRKKNKVIHKEKLCPFLDQNCVKTQCEIYNEILNRCEIGVIAYNLYRLSEVEKQRLDSEPDSD